MGKKKQEYKPVVRAAVPRRHTVMAPPNHMCGPLANLVAGSPGNATPVLLTEYADILGNPSTIYSRLDPHELEQALLSQPAIVAAAEKASRLQKIPTPTAELRDAAAKAIDVALIQARTNLRRHLDLLVEFALVKLCQEAEHEAEEQERRRRLAAFKQRSKSND